MLCFNVLYAFGSNGNSPATITIPALPNIKLGQQFDIELNVAGLTKADSAISYQFDFKYDDALVQYDSTNVVGTLSDGGEIAINKSTSGLLKISYMRDAAIVTAGTLVKLTFVAKASGVFTPSLNNFLFNSKSVSSLVLNKVSISPYVIAGKVMDEQNQIITSGYVFLLKKLVNKFQQVDSVSIQSGYYKFSNLLTGDYTVFVIPSVDVYPQALPSYLGNKATWSLATVLSLVPGFVDKSYDILIPFMSVLKGTATIKGVVEWGNNVAISGLKSAKGILGKPVKKLSVVLRSANKSTGNIIARTETDEFGNFEFTQVPDGLYVVEVDMPGYPMIQIPQITVDKGVALAADGKTTFDKIEMVVETEGVKMSSNIFNPVKLDSYQSFSFSLFPNPVSNELFITDLDVASIQHIDVYNQLGITLISLNSLVKSINVSQLSIGTYYLKVTTAKGTSVVPFIVSR